MMEIAGRGGKRPLLNIEVDRLHPDPDNPRLPVELRGKSESDILLALKRYFDLEELAYSMSENGYFDEEPLVGIPIELPEKFLKEDTVSLTNNKEYLDYLNEDSAHFFIAEGNRRLSTVMILLSKSLQLELKIKSWPEISDEVRDDIKSLPVIVYPTRKEVLPYLGVRHIAGIKKWDAFSKALYIAGMVEKRHSIDDIQKQVGDRSNSARKIYYCYRLIKEAEDELDLDTQRAKEYFSYLLLSSGQRNIREFLGAPKKWIDIDFENPVPTDKLNNLRYLFSWLFGEGTKVLPVVKESRDITNFLSYVIGSKDALEHLISTRDLTDAYERSDGEQGLLLKNLKNANRRLENSLGIIHRHKEVEDVKKQVFNCKETLDIILKIFEE